MPSQMEPVSLTQALGRGAKMRCPNCGRGRLFSRFLKVADQCSECGEVFSHHRADDFPAYLVIVIAGHLLVPAILVVELHYGPPLWVDCLIWLPLTFICVVALLQPTKGAIVGLQWQTGMHGFARSKQSRQVAAE